VKQVLIRKGRVKTEDVPAPLLEDNSVLVEVAYSLISVGTEMKGLEKSGESLFGKTIKQPGKIKKLIKVLKEKGVEKTIDIIEKKTGKTSQTGYSCSGVVIQTGKNITGLKPGDIIACAGAGKANHAEIVLVPENLVVKIPEGCSVKEAASVTLGSIAMQGIRRADVRLGENVAIIGLGLLGQLTNQLLKVAGCRTIGFDLQKHCIDLALELGLDKGFPVSLVDLTKEVMNCTNGYGVDATIITASSTSNTIAQQAMKITRKKGKVVVVGDVGLNLQRQPFYEKEIDFLISCSYGPGRYDSAYEEKGLDYPYAYVRWTENRNMREYLNLIAEEKINFMKLVDKIYDINNASKAYAELKGKGQKPLAILLDYHLGDLKKLQKKMRTTVNIATSRKGKRKNVLNISVIGAGNFAKSVHLPNLKEFSDLYSIRAIVDKIGSNAKETAKRYKANYCSTDYYEVLDDNEVEAVLITTRHNLHAKIVIDALKAGKHVFVEKPLALNKAELMEIIETYNSTDAILMVGFNRRFSPAARRVKEILKERENPIIVNYRVNAGYIPLDNWIHTEEGGGRIIGEACHMFDLFNYLTEADVESIDVSSVSPKTEHISARDNFTTTLKYTDGSICSLTYTALGSKDLDKEYIEIYSDNKTMVIDDFKELKVYGANFKGWKGNQDKGHLRELKEFARSLIEGGPLPIPIKDLISTTETCFIVDKGVRE